MTNSLSIALNSLNQNFYRTVENAFSKTRSQPWPGWSTLRLLQKDHVETSRIIFDVGCGNGRFGEYIAPHIHPNSRYIGIDSNRFLLAQCARRLQPHYESIDLRRKDLLEEIISASPSLSTLTNDDSCRADIVALFGVWHHLPDMLSRLQMLHILKRNLAEGGFIWLSTWEFTKNESLMKRKATLQQAGITITSDAEWGPNDFILDWHRGQNAYRYCHFSTQQEMQQLFSLSELICIHAFTPDSGSDQDNRYYLLKPAL